MIWLLSGLLFGVLFPVLSGHSRASQPCFVHAKTPIFVTFESICFCYWGELFLSPKPVFFVTGRRVFLSLGTPFFVTGRATFLLLAGWSQVHRLCYSLGNCKRYTQNTQPQRTNAPKTVDPPRKKPGRRAQAKTAGPTAGPGKSFGQSSATTFFPAWAPYATFTAFWQEPRRKSPTRSEFRRPPRSPNNPVPRPHLRIDKCMLGGRAAGDGGIHLSISR